MISDAFVLVSCDTSGCKYSEEFSLCALATRGCWDERDLKKEIEAAGWTVRSKFCYCPDHTPSPEAPDVR